MMDNIWFQHGLVFAFSVAFTYAEAFYIELVTQRLALPAGVARGVAAALGLGPAIYAASQPDHFWTMLACLAVGQGLGSALKVRKTAGRWL